MQQPLRGGDRWGDRDVGRGRGESPDDRGRVLGLAEPPLNGDRDEVLQGHSMASREELCPGHRKGVQG